MKKRRQQTPMIPELLLHCFFSLSPPLSAWRGIRIRFVGMSERRRGALQKPYHFLSYPRPRHALLSSARTSTAHLPAQAIYAQANRQTLPERALSRRLSVPFCSIPTKLNFKARGGGQPLDHYVLLPPPVPCPSPASAAQEPANILLMSANFIYLWFVLYYNILEQLKLYNGPFHAPPHPSSSPSHGSTLVPNSNMAAVLLDGSLFGRIFRSFSVKCRCICIMIYWLWLPLPLPFDVPF